MAAPLLFSFTFRISNGEKKREREKKTNSFVATRSHFIPFLPYHINSECVYISIETDFLMRCQMTKGETDSSSTHMHIALYALHATQMLSFCFSRPARYTQTYKVNLQSCFIVSGLANTLDSKRHDYNPLSCLSCQRQTFYAKMILMKSLSL